MGQDLLIQPGATKYFNFNYYQKVTGISEVVKVVGYGCVGKQGMRSDHWRPSANWARRVLHACNLQTEWSELPDVLRSTVGRLAGVARMPFCAPGIMNAQAALAALPRAY